LVLYSYYMRLHSSCLSCLLHAPFLFFMIPPPPRSTLFPYTTLFRSFRRPGAELVRARDAPVSERRTAHRPSQDLLGRRRDRALRSEEHTSELQSLTNLVCRLLLEKKKKNNALSVASLST